MPLATAAAAAEAAAANGTASVSSASSPGDAASGGADGQAGRRLSVSEAANFLDSVDEEVEVRWAAGYLCLNSWRANAGCRALYSFLVLSDVLTSVSISDAWFAYLLYIV